MKYKYPTSINTPEARKVYRSLKRQIKRQKQSADEYFNWFKEERDNYNSLKQQVINLANS